MSVLKKGRASWLHYLVPNAGRIGLGILRIIARIAHGMLRIASCWESRSFCRFCWRWRWWSRVCRY